VEEGSPKDPNSPSGANPSVIPGCQEVDKKETKGEEREPVGRKRPHREELGGSIWRRDKCSWEASFREERCKEKDMMGGQRAGNPSPRGLGRSRMKNLWLQRSYGK